MPTRVLFVCTSNSARSQMAEALLDRVDGFDAHSAGIYPAAQINPLTVKALAAIGIDRAGATPMAVSSFVDGTWDYVITLSPEAKAQAPDFPGAKRLDWPVTDPTTEGTDAAFRAVMDDLRTRIDAFVKVARAAGNGSQKMMMDRPADAAGMRKHMVAAEPNGHAAADGPLADMPMPDMVAKHDAMHKAGAGAHHTHAFAPTKAVKFVKDQPDMIEGLAIPFGGHLAGKDFDGEFFDASTDLCLPWFGETGRPILYGHGLNSATKAEVIGRQTSLDLRDDGYWIKAELDKRSRYHAAISKLVGQDALSFSSGAMPHLVQTGKGGHIDRWPWVENSLTPTPANALAVVYAVKSADMAEHFAAANIDIPDPLAAALKALDEWASIRDAAPGSESLADHAGRVSAAVVELAEHAQQNAEMRTKVGREMSAANRDRMAAALATRDPYVAAHKALMGAFDDLQALLSATDPQAGKRLADAALAEWEYLSMRLPRP